MVFSVYSGFLHQ